MPEEVLVMIVIMSAIFLGSSVWAGVHLLIKKKELEMRGSDPELGRVVDVLRDDLDDTREHVAELQERLDTAERLLTSGRAKRADRGEGPV